LILQWTPIIASTVISLAASTQSLFPGRSIDFSESEIDSFIDTCREEFPDAVRNPSADGGISIAFANGHRVICAYGVISSLAQPEIALLSGEEPYIIVARSSGGSVEPWLVMIERLRQRPAAIIVDGLCASSCANYAFVAARQKIVGYGGFVVWHGGPTLHPDALSRTGLFDQNGPAVEQFERLANRTESLYRRLGVSLELLNDTMLSAPSNLDRRAFDNDEQQLVGFAVPPEVLTECYHVGGLDRMWHPGGAVITQFTSASLFGGGWIAIIPEMAEQRGCVPAVGLRGD